jgi:hypothetical protein
MFWRLSDGLDLHEDGEGKGMPDCGGNQFRPLMQMRRHGIRVRPP